MDVCFGECLMYEETNFKFLKVPAIMMLFASVFNINIILVET